MQGGHFFLFTDVSGVYEDRKHLHDSYTENRLLLECFGFEKL